MRKTSKIKRIVAGLLALLLTVALLPAQTARIAKADDPVPTIPDLNATGSLTIHKYEYNVIGGTAGTGESTDMTTNGIDIGTTGDDPTLKAIPLNGVTFGVVFISNLDTYYTKDGAALPKASDYSSTYNDAYFTSTTNEIADPSGFNATGKWMKVTTANVDSTDGIAKISNLPLGIYFVHEISAPAQITGKAADFLVSIPMTRQGTATAGQEWLYDVHVFPKNSSTYGGVTLLKKGKIGNGTANPLSGAYFILEKYTGGSWIKVETDNKGNSIGTTETIDGASVDHVLTTKSDGKITVSNLAPGKYRFREIGAPAGYIMDGVSTYEFTVADQAGIDSDSVSYQAGDILIDGKKVDTSTDPITVTNYQPTVEKNVQKKDGTWGIDADYSAGDTIPYRLKVYVPENVAKLRSFSLTDKLTNQKFVDVTPPIKYYSDEACTVEINDISETITKTSDSEWTIAFNSYDSGTKVITSGISNHAGEIIYIRFDATLNSGATVGPTGNKNEIDLSYSNKIVPDSEPADPDKDEIHDEVIVYTFELQITKENSAGTKLEGITFDLYKEVASLSETNSADDNAAKAAGLDSGKYWKKISTLVTDSGGNISQSGLSNGTYYLIETDSVASDGTKYNLLKAPVEVTISVNYTSAKSGTPIVVSNNTFNDNSGIANDGIHEITIVNSTGFTLPTTGGIGSAIFVFVGVSMMVAAVILFFVSRKKENEKTKQ